MLVSFVLRLRPEQLARGRLVGEVEQVDTGQQRGLRDVADLVEFCCRAASPRIVGPVKADRTGSVVDE